MEMETETEAEAETETGAGNYTWRGSLWFVGGLRMRKSLQGSLKETWMEDLNEEKQNWTQSNRNSNGSGSGSGSGSGKDCPAMHLLASDRAPMLQRGQSKRLAPRNWTEIEFLTSEAFAGHIRRHWAPFDAIRLRSTPFDVVRHQSIQHSMPPSFFMLNLIHCAPLRDSFTDSRCWSWNNSEDPARISRNDNRERIPRQWTRWNLELRIFQDSLWWQRPVWLNWPRCVSTSLLNPKESCKDLVGWALIAYYKNDHLDRFCFS